MELHFLSVILLISLLTLDHQNVLYVIIVSHTTLIITNQLSSCLIISKKLSNALMPKVSQCTLSHKVGGLRERWNGVLLLKVLTIIVL